MDLKIILLITPVLLLSSSLIYADSSTQTDWSGGPGVLGPVNEWGNDFYSASNVNWSDSPGSVLHQIVIEHLVDYNYSNNPALCPGDIDGDGDVDLVGCFHVSAFLAEFVWWENVYGLGTSWVKHGVGDSLFYGQNYFTWSLCTDDIDGDGDIDFVSRVPGGTYPVLWYENTDGLGTSWIVHIIGGLYADLVYFQTDDIDCDGDMDVLCACWDFSVPNILWYENTNGSGTSWTEHLIDEDFSNIICIYSEDIDGDGDIDVLGASNAETAVAWWENTDGSGTSWLKHFIDEDSNSPNSIYSGDIDNDEDMDVLVGSSDGIVWWENTGGSGTTWIDHDIDLSNSASKVHSTDMDGDGDLDAFGVSGSINWWENADGLGLSWVKHYVANHDVQVLHAEDINGDGDSNLVGFSWGSIFWWAYSETGELESSILDTGCDPQWAAIDWNGTEPPGSDLYFQYRTSGDPGSMGMWSDPIYDPCLLAGLLDQYIQYKVILQTTDSTATTSLDNVTFIWNPVGIGEPVVTETHLSGAYCNPSSGTAIIGFSLEESSAATILVYDASGRLVEDVNSEFPQGQSLVEISDLRPGIYFVKMISGDFTGTQRFVMIE